MRHGLRYGQTRHDYLDGTTLVKGVCKLGHHSHEVTVPTDGLDAWIAGDLIQQAMPEVSVDVREFLISASCGPCFDRLFKYDSGADYNPEREN